MQQPGFDRYDWAALVVVVSMGVLLLGGLVVARGVVVAATVCPLLAVYCWYVRRSLATRLRERN